MNPVIKGAAVYLFLLIIFRIMGRRSMAEITTFDFVLLLIIGEATQQALLGDDYSLTNALIVIVVLVGVDLVLTFTKGKFKVFDKIIDGAPLILVDKGVMLRIRMKKTGIEEDDILEAARMLHGLEAINQIKYAVLERDGSISIIPADKGDCPS
ncbi:MAG: DUF421 domain-containing protein [Williamsia sp.]|nr:DUF421 domain-containing protein [Williamsia sp.]